MRRIKCEECGGRIIKKNINYNYLGEYVGKFPAEVCTKCGEIVFDEDISDKIETIVKEKGLYGLGATTKVGIAGSSFVIRITKKLADFLGLKKGEEVHIHPESRGRVIVEKYQSEKLQ